MQFVDALRNNIALHRFVRVRHRYLLTRSNRLRLRYVVGSVVTMSLMSTGLLGAMSSSVAYVPAAQDMASLSYDDVNQADYEYASVTATESAEVQNDAENVPGILVDDSHDLAALDIKEPQKPLEPREEIVKVGAGETLAGVLQGVGVSGTDAYNAVKELSKHLDPRSVKAGQALAVRLEPGNNGLEFAELNMKIDPIKEVSVAKTGGETFKSKLKEKKVLLHTNAAKASIESSLYGSAARAGIPASVVGEMIRIYSYEVDFQRDIRQGDTIEILYETYETEDGDFARYGNVLYANLTVSGKTRPVYRFADNDGNADYYTADGMSVKKTLMRTPIDGARMSSGFGMRHHPVLGYNKMHKGVDFAASRGTPIYAAGDGVVEVAGRKGAYGNYVRIKHNGTLKTAYAHMHKFAKNVTVGTRVKQGQVIGYVGTTGRSTGPHLHFEVLKNGQQVNPNSIDLPMGNRLAGKSMERFKKNMAKVHAMYAEMAKGMKFAQNATGGTVSR